MLCDVLSNCSAFRIISITRFLFLKLYVNKFYYYDSRDVVYFGLRSSYIHDTIETGFLTPGYRFFLTDYFFLMCKQFTFCVNCHRFFLTIGSFLPFFVVKKWLE